MCGLKFESIKKHWIMTIFILAFLIGTLGTVSGAPNFRSIIYSREQLLALQHIAISSVPKMEIPVELRRRRGCRAGIKH